MKGKQKVLSPSFRAKVALDAVKGDKTVAEISSKYGVHATQISRWKKLLVEELPSLFEDGRSRKSQAGPDQELVDKLYRQIGQLTVENDWLKKKSEEILK